MPAREEILRFFVEDCDLLVIPVHSVDENGKCTCRNKLHCKKEGKHPYLNSSWKKRATGDLDTLNKMVSKRNVNYGVVTGRKSAKSGKYLVVVDVDKPDHEIIKTLPKTFSYKTGKGFHFWYWADKPIKCSYGGVSDKVDIKGSDGYVIAPPSKHKSGKHYELLYDLGQQIVDLPEEIRKATEVTLETSQNKRRITKKTKPVVATDNWWHNSPIPEIRAKIEDGTKIPLGVRNITIHRMLSSHRAKGTATYEDLMTLALHYRSCLEDPESFDDRELRGIVVSVMRYPVYNSNSENVNKNYCKWLEKHGIKSDLEMVEQVDALFFSSLKPGKSLVSLEWITETRNKWYAGHDIKEFARYKPQFLAHKLKSLGFMRTRTAKANLWGVDTNAILLAHDNESCDDVSIRREQQMSDNTEVTSEEQVEGTESGEEEASASGPIGPDGQPLTLIETREEIITADRKYHPNDYKFNGMQQSSQDLLMAQLKMFEKLTPDQEVEFEAGTLIYDEERTRDFMDALLPGDIVGIRNTMYRIVSVNDDGLVGTPRAYNKYDRKYHFETPEETVSIYDLDASLTMGFGEILYRNDKPFGLDDEMTYKVVVKVYADSVGRTYVFKGGREVIKHQQPSEEKNVTGKESP